MGEKGLSAILITVKGVEGVVLTMHAKPALFHHAPTSWVHAHARAALLTLRDMSVITIRDRPSLRHAGQGKSPRSLPSRWAACSYLPTVRCDAVRTEGMGLAWPLPSRTAGYDDDDDDDG